MQGGILPPPVALLLLFPRHSNRRLLEHPVPKSIITEHILSTDDAGPDGEQLRNALHRAFNELMPICWILKKEDEILGAAGLKKRIPGDPAWDSIDPWARYKQVQIPIVGGYNPVK